MIVIVTMDFMQMSMAFVPVTSVNMKKIMRRKRNITLRRRLESL